MRIDTTAKTAVQNSRQMNAYQSDSRVTTLREFFLFEDIAHSPDGFYQFALGIAVDFIPQAAHARFNNVGLRIKVNNPRRVP